LHQDRKNKDKKEQEGKKPSPPSPRRGGDRDRDRDRSNNNDRPRRSNNDPTFRPNRRGAALSRSMEAALKDDDLARVIELFLEHVEEGERALAAAAQGGGGEAAAEALASAASGGKEQPATHSPLSPLHLSTSKQPSRDAMGMVTTALRRRTYNGERWSDHLFGAVVKAAAVDAALWLSPPFGASSSSPPAPSKHLATLLMRAHLTYGNPRAALELFDACVAAAADDDAQRPPPHLREAALGPSSSSSSPGGDPHHPHRGRDYQHRRGASALYPTAEQVAAERRYSQRAPNFPLYALAIDACLVSGDLRRAAELVSAVDKGEVPLSDAAAEGPLARRAAALARLQAAEGNFDAALVAMHAVISRGASVGLSTYASVMDSAAAAGRLDVARLMLRLAEAAGTQEQAAAAAAAEKSGEGAEGEEQQQQRRRKAASSPYSPFSSFVYEEGRVMRLLAAAARGASPELAREALALLQQQRPGAGGGGGSGASGEPSSSAARVPSAAAYHALIDAHVRARDWAGAFDAVHELQRQIPDASSSASSSCGGGRGGGGGDGHASSDPASAYGGLAFFARALDSEEALSGAYAALQARLQRQEPVTTAMMNVVLRGMARLGNADAAARALAAYPKAPLHLEPDVDSHTAVIEACAEAGDLQRAEAARYAALQQGLHFPPVATGMFLRAAVKAGDVAAAAAVVRRANWARRRGAFAPDALEAALRLAVRAAKAKKRARGGAGGGDEDDGGDKKEEDDLADDADVATLAVELHARGLGSVAVRCGVRRSLRDLPSMRELEERVEGTKGSGGGVSGRGMRNGGSGGGGGGGQRSQRGGGGGNGNGSGNGGDRRRGGGGSSKYGAAAEIDAAALLAAEEAAAAEDGAKWSALRERLRAASSSSSSPGGGGTGGGNGDAQ
jgi:hypothetical protein